MSLASTRIQRILKVAILLLLLGSLVYHLWGDDNLQDLPGYWLQQAHLWPVMLVVLLLMPINWGIEALKWQYLLRSITQISYLTSCKAVLAGVAFALFTPNRMGEYLGRIWVLEANYRVRGVLVTLVNSLAQIITTLCIGLLALTFWTNPTQVMLSSLTFSLISIVVLAMVGFYFTFPYWVERIGVWQPTLTRKKWFRILRVLQRIPARQLAWVLLYSILRYVIYSGQYVILLLALTPVNLDIAMVAVPLLFLFQMGIPVPAVLEIGIRGSLAANLLSPYGASAISVLVATSTLWVVNLILPAIVGGVIIGTLKMKE